MWRLISDDGTSRYVDQLIDRLGCDDDESDDEQLFQTIVERTGYIAVQETRSTLRVIMRPSLIGPVPLAALMFALADNASRTARITIIEDGRREECCTDPLAFLKRVDSIVDEARRGVGGRFAMRRPVAVPRAEQKKVRQVAKQLASTPRLTTELLRFLRDEFDDRFFMIEGDRPERCAWVVEAGSGMRILSDWVRRDGLPLAVRHHPDIAYGRWLEVHYLAALTSRTECSDEVSVRLVAGPGNRRHTYRRYLLPMQDDQMLALSVPAA